MLGGSLYSSSLLLEPLLPCASPSLAHSRHRLLVCAPLSTMPIVLPIGEQLPMRSPSEDNDICVDERPRERDPEREPRE